MDQKESSIEKILSKIESLEDLLADALPKTDKRHREEVLDICLLLRQRAEMYMREYGLNEEVEV